MGRNCPKLHDVIYRRSFFTLRPYSPVFWWARSDCWRSWRTVMQISSLTFNQPFYLSLLLLDLHFSNFIRKHFFFLNTLQWPSLLFGSFKFETIFIEIMYLVMERKPFNVITVSIIIHSEWQYYNSKVQFINDYKKQSVRASNWLIWFRDPKVIVFIEIEKEDN